ncbi:MAG TPA: antibiotic biosynthesis monooxygenase [Acidimicrobiales bacterium]|nr:antibiotic biosynthesis monooxygenase [Acidimicrobiales bacterium]
MLAISGILRFKPEDRDEVIEGLAWVTERSLADAGCIEYWYAEDLVDRGSFRFFECWESVETFEAHRAAPYEEEFTQRYLTRLVGAGAAQYEITTREVLAADEH